MTKKVTFNTNCVTLGTSKIQLSDINEILSIAKNCFSEPWSKELFLSEISSTNSVCIKVSIKEKIIAYIIAKFLVDELHIMHLAVLPKFRRQGIARFLVTKLINDYKAETYILEVRESNSAAIDLYKSMEFIIIGKRKNYYSNGENAIVMTRKEKDAR